MTEEKVLLGEGSSLRRNTQKTFEFFEIKGFDASDLHDNHNNYYITVDCICRRKFLMNKEEQITREEEERKYSGCFLVLMNIRRAHLLASIAGE